MIMNVIKIPCAWKANLVHGCKPKQLISHTHTKTFNIDVHVYCKQYGKLSLFDNSDIKYQSKQGTCNVK